MSIPPDVRNRRAKRFGIRLLVVAVLVALGLTKEFSITRSTVAQTRPQENDYATTVLSPQPKDDQWVTDDLLPSLSATNSSETAHQEPKNSTWNSGHLLPNPTTNATGTTNSSLAPNPTTSWDSASPGNWTNGPQESWNATRTMVHRRFPNATTGSPEIVGANETDFEDEGGSFTNNATGWKANRTFQNNSAMLGESTMEGASNRTTDLSSFNISIVLQLSGEMGNHLSKMAMAHVLQEDLWNNHGIASHLVLQHQERVGGKWRTAMEDLIQCFPNLRDLDYSAGNSEAFHRAMRRQQIWLGDKDANGDPMPLILPLGRRPSSTLLYLENLLRFNRSSIPNTFEYRKPEDTVHISLPFVYVQNFVSWHGIDQHYSSLKKYFEFDKDACCAGLPYENENIFHFRNFVGEMPRIGVKKGFSELNPNRTAYELFGNLTTGEKIAMVTSRRVKVGNDTTQSYMDAFLARGLSVRLIENQTGPEDFCFLQHGKRMIAGMARSTFFVWASLLGNTSKARLYSMDSNFTRNALGKDAVVDYEWQDQELRERIEFVSFKEGR